MVGILGGKKDEDTMIRPIGGKGGLFSSSSGPQPSSGDKKTPHEIGVVVLAVSILLTAVMILITGHLITPFSYEKYGAGDDIVPVVFTYLLEGVLVFLGIYIAVTLMKVRGARFKWSTDVPYIVGISTIAIIVTNIVLYYMGVNFNSWQTLFGGYGLALVHATVGSIAGSFALKKIGKSISVFNLTVVAIITTVVLFVMAHMVLPSSGLGSYVMF